MNGPNADGIAQILEGIYIRLEFIDGYTAEARAASILAVSLGVLIFLMKLNFYCLQI